jgi:tetratricopeptide (TPR) repeat protein
LDLRSWIASKELVLRKLLTLLTLLLLGAAAAYFAGVHFRMPLDSAIRKSAAPGPGQELNKRGINELSAGNPEGAVAVLREARKLEPDNGVIVRNLSIALAREANSKTGDEQAAIELLNESLQLWSKNPEGLDGLSTIHFKAARYKDALEPALILKQLMPDRADLAQYVVHLQRKVADERGMSSEMGDRFRLLYSDKRKLDYEGEILSILQTQLDSLTVALGIFPDKPIDVLLLTEDLGAMADPVDPFLEGLYDGQIRLYIGSGIDDRQKLIITVRHEMVHALLHQAAGNLPGWVQEGLAQKAGEEPGEDHLRAARRYVASEIRGGHPVDLATMGITFINLDEESRTTAYATSLLFMDYLSRVYGDGFIPRFVAELISGTSSDDALKVVTGMTFHQLQASFSSDLEGGS